MNRLMIAPLVGLLFALCATLGIALPDTMTQPAVVATAALVIAAVTMVSRWNAGALSTDLKYWWQSRVIVTQIVTALLSVGALFGVISGFNPEGLIEIVMIGTTLASALWLRKPQALIVG